MSSPRPIITIITTSHYNRICKKETRNALFLKMVLWKFSFFLINFPSAFVHVHFSTNQGYVHPITTIITTSNYNRICKKKKKQTRNALFLVMVRVREFTRAFFHIHHVLFAFNLWWKSEVLTTMLLLLLTTFWIASSRSNWFVAKMNIVSFKSSSLHTFNKDVFCDSFNVRNCQDCSCWLWNRERKVEVVQKFFKVNGRDSFAGYWSFLVESPQQIR